MSSPSATPTRFIGLDLHKHYLIAIAVDPAGAHVGGPWRVTLEHFDAWARQHLTRLDAVAVEITTNTYTVYDALRPLVHSVTVVHPPHLALITRVPVKTDNRAALVLAQFLAKGMLSALSIPLRRCANSAPAWPNAPSLRGCRRRPKIACTRPCIGITCPYLKPARRSRR